jgi:ABC-type phosphate/phosphonate transport system substrate-binding protein
MNDNSVDGLMTRREFAAWLGAAAATASVARIAMGETARPLRIGVSVESLGGANVNDARAAYKVWSHELFNLWPAKSVELIPDIFVPSDQMVQMIRQGTVDMCGITAWEYVRVVNFVEPSAILVEEDVAKGMEYVLLVHNNSPYKKLSDLRGRQITIHNHPHMNLLPAWIGNMLATERLPRMDAFFNQQVARSSVTQIVLSVFFHRMDSAALLRKDYETAVEMNPQLGRDLHELAVSPNIVPALCCFRKGSNREYMEKLIAVVSRMESMPSGQEIVALYKARILVTQPASYMNLTVNMLRQYERVTAQPPGQRKEHS